MCIRDRLALLNHAVFRRHDTAVGAGQNTGVAADAFVPVYGNHPILDGQGSSDTALHAKRLLAVAAGNRKADPVVFLNLNPGADRHTLQGVNHILFPGIGIGTVIFTHCLLYTSRCV